MNTSTSDHRIGALSSGLSRCVTREVTVRNSDGLHLLPAAELVALAGKFQSVIRLVVDGCIYETRTIIDLLAANLRQGKRAMVIAEGVDAEAAAAAVDLFFAGYAFKQPSPSETPLRTPEVGALLERALKRAA